MAVNEEYTGNRTSPARSPLVDSWLMTGVLDDVLQTLRDHEYELKRMGASHAAVFGSVARGEAKPSSDIDVLVDLDPERRPGNLPIR